jgi:hypothetical protein
MNHRINHVNQRSTIPVLFTIIRSSVELKNKTAAATTQSTINFFERSSRSLSLLKFLSRSHKSQAIKHDNSNTKVINDTTDTIDHYYDLHCTSLHCTALHCLSLSQSDDTNNNNNNK